MSGLTIRNNGMRMAVWNLNKNQNRMQKALEHLSSGYRINRSADDAAGLAVSERMRSQIRGLDQAADNCNEGIHLLTVGEGMLTEIHSMLQRSNILAEQSANGVYLDERDRESLQEELDQICAEIERVTQNANYNGIRLFQNYGYSYETSLETEVNSGDHIRSFKQQAAVHLRKSTPEIRIAAYRERADAASSVYALPREGGLENGVGGQLDIVVSPSGQRLSEVLRDEIVPNVVKNLLANYPAFSGLQKESIGIGLRLYNDNSSKTLAFLSNEASRDFSSARAYSLNVNLNCLRKMADDGEIREELEAAVAREITRGFLYEVAGAGMLGYDGAAASAAGRFPEWFVEGMALTASGAGEWLGYMGLNKASDREQVAAVLKNPAARLDSGSPLGVNGTGYLACMYLGAMAGGVCGKVDPDAGEEVIARGLSNILALARSQGSTSGTASGNPLDGAIRELSFGRFAGAADFCEKFSTDEELIKEAAGFISGLLKKTGSGRGGLSTGDLSAADLAADAASGSLPPFRLDISRGVVQNTGGTTAKPYTPVYSGYGDLFVSGVEDPSDIEYDEASNTLTVRGGENIELSMKSGVASSSLNKIVVDGAARVTLNEVKLKNADALTIKNDAQIVYRGYNELGGINLTESYGADFLGTGQLQIGKFTTGSDDNRVRFAGGAVLISGRVGKVTSIIVDDAAVYGGAVSVVNSAGRQLTNDLSFRWSDIQSSIREITSIELDGKKIDLLLKRDQLVYLWRERPGQDVDDLSIKNHLTVRGSGGAVQHLETTQVKVQIPGSPTFYRKDWAPLTDGIPVFKVEGGVKNKDYIIGTDGTLTILSSAQMTISGGKGLEKGNSKTGTLGKEIYGKIKVADNLGSVNLILDDVVCDKASNVSALDLGTGNDVNLTLVAGSTNIFRGTDNSNHAGISLGTGTSVTINSAGGVGSTEGKLVASGTRGAAGIGSNGTGTFNRGTINTPTTSCGNITINGGTIEATGGTDGGAGIGGGNYGSCGKITINGGKITATGTKHGAGIGGGWYDADHRSSGNGAITITGGEITAVCLEHGTGIGAGCMGTSGAITITGDAVIKRAVGGVSAAGIGASASGRCASISILGNATVKSAEGGANGAGIGAGAREPNAYGSFVGDIVINTTGTVMATGGDYGVGIGCGPSSEQAGGESSGLSSCGDIQILGGVVDAAGGVNSTGIGAGKGSVSGNITIGDEKGSREVVVTATGGMSFNGGNILSYKDPGHTVKGELSIVGGNTTVRAGYLGEGRYSTSGAVNSSGASVFAYPLYLMVSGLLLPAGNGLENFPLSEDVDRNSIRITATGKSDGKSFSWSPGLSHAPLEKGYDFIWMTGQDQQLTVEYDTASGGKRSYTLELIFDEPTGIFRTGKQEKLDELAQVPDYYPAGTRPEKKFYLPQDTFDPGQDPFPEGKPDGPVPIPGAPDPDSPDPSKPDPPKPDIPGSSDSHISGQKKEGRGGIILQVGASSKETLGIPRFYLSLEALKMGEIDISTQENAQDAIPVIQKAIERVSTVRGVYGAFANRLEHNIHSLELAEENIQAAESRIRDADMAEERGAQLVSSICTQSAQAMLAQCNLQAGRILGLLQ